MKKQNPLLLVLLAIVVLAGAAAVYFFFLRTPKDDSATAEAPATASASALIPAAPQTGSANEAPVPKVLVIDRAAILGGSKVGQDIGRQIQAFNNQAKSELTNQAAGLKAEQATLQQQIAIMAPDIRQKRQAAFEAKAQELQASAQRKEAQLQATLQQAQGTVAQALQPIVVQIAHERGASMMLDRQAVVWAPDNNNFDVTQDVIKRLDAKMTTLKVTLVNLNAAPPK